MAKQKATWKAVERRVAEMLGGQRIPVTGRHNQETPDINHPKWAPEVKHRKMLPAWLTLLARVHAPAYVDNMVGPDFVLMRLHDVAKLPKRNNGISRPGNHVLIARSFTGVLHEAIQQATTAATKHKKLPLVVLHQKNQPIGESICVIPL